MLKEAVSAGTNFIETGVNSFDQWSAMMIHEFGPSIRPVLRDVMQWSLISARKRQASWIARQNCWEFFHCQKDAEVNCMQDPGTCPAALETRLDGIHGGKNGGRTCWAVAGTKCGSTVQRYLFPRILLCGLCEFRKAVLQEEGADFVVSDDFLKMLIH